MSEVARWLRLAFPFKNGLNSKRHKTRFLLCKLARAPFRKWTVSRRNNMLENV